MTEATEPNMDVFIVTCPVCGDQMNHYELPFHLSRVQNYSDTGIISEIFGILLKEIAELKAAMVGDQDAQ